MYRIDRFLPQFLIRLENPFILPSYHRAWNIIEDAGKFRFRDSKIMELVGMHPGQHRCPRRRAHGECLSQIQLVINIIVLYVMGTGRA